MQTAERVSSFDKSDNVIYQRHLVAYYTAIEHIKGKLLEVGSGEGYGIPILIDHCNKYVAVDKHKPSTGQDFSDKFSFKEMSLPPLLFEDESFDSLVSFQVIEHIEDDEAFVKEIARVLKKGAKAVITTPNRLMSLTRNPWHVREYTWQQLKTLLGKHFSNVEMLGVYGNGEIDAYYEKNKASVNKITRFDVLKLQYRLPRKLLQIPYDILNRFNRKNLASKNQQLVNHINWKDFTTKKAAENCYDLLAIATK